MATKHLNLVMANALVLVCFVSDLNMAGLNMSKGEWDSRVIADSWCA